MNKGETLRYLDEHNVKYEISEHREVFSMEELDLQDLPYSDRTAKNLFVRDDKKQNYYLITVLGNKRVDLKEFRIKYGLRHLSFASPDNLAEILHLTPGSVTPLGLLNDNGRTVKLYLDSAFGDGIIGVHPNDNTATVWLSVPDLLRLISDHGNEYSVVDI